MTEHDQTAYEAEVKERWGDTEAYAESQRRTKSYTKEDMEGIKAELAEIEQALADAMADGATPDSERATDLAEAARLHIDKWFYPCSHQMHVGLAAMYTDDPRFTAHYEERAIGLAAYVRAAIEANAERR